MAVIEVALAEVHEGERAREDYDVADLVESIRQLGMLQPITVRPREAGGYELVAGGRRLRAAKELGEWLIRAEVRDADDAEALVIEAVENGIRQGFKPSEAAALGRRLEQLAETDPSILGKLPSGARVREQVAKAVGMSDGTYAKASSIVGYEATTEHGRALAALIEARMDETGKVDGPYRLWRGLRWCEQLLADELDALHDRPAKLLADAVDDIGNLDDLDDIEGRWRGWADAVRRNHQIPAGTDVADPAAADEHDVALGGSDASPPEASEPTPAWKDLSGAQREAMANLYRAGELRYSNKTTDTTIYHLVADHLADRGLVAIFAPEGTPLLDGRVVTLSNLGAEVMGVFAHEWWKAQRATLNMASDFELVSGSTPNPWFQTWSVWGRDDRAFRALVIEAGHHTLSPILRTLDEAHVWLAARKVGPFFEAAPHDRWNETPTTAGGDDDADGKGSAGPSELATEHDASAAPAADDAGESASEPPATPAGPRPEGWPPRAEGHPSLGAMKSLGFSAAFYAAGRQLADWILDGDTPEEAVERLQAGPGCLSDEQLDYVLAHFDVPAPAPAADPGSEPPASIGVNEDHGTTILEGDELAPDPSTEVPATTSTTEGEVSDGAVPAPLPSEDGEPEFRRSGSPSTTRRAEKKRPVPVADFVQLAHHLAAATSIAREHQAAEVEMVLAVHDDPEALIDRYQAAADVLIDYLRDLRLLARPPG